MAILLLQNEVPMLSFVVKSLLLDSFFFSFFLA